MRPITKSLITVICGFYLAALLLPGLQEQLFLIDRAILSDGQIHGVATGEYWRILTVALTHGGIAHLFFNMYALLLLGNSLEEALGRNKFLVIFLVAQVGASFAIFGLFGAMAVLSKKFGFEDRSIYAIIGINFAIGFILPGIDWQAHLGGLISGVLVSLFLLAPTRR